jgi:thiol-disulfide isomerase/thioredoxin
MLFLNYHGQLFDYPAHFISKDSNNKIIPLSLDVPKCMLLEFDRGFEEKTTIVAFSGDTINIIFEQQTGNLIFDGKRQNEYLFASKFLKTELRIEDIKFSNNNFGTESHLSECKKKLKIQLNYLKNANDSLKFSKEFYKFMVNEIYYYHIASLLSSYKPDINPSSKFIKYVHKLKKFFYNNSNWIGSKIFPQAIYSYVQFNSNQDKNDTPHEIFLKNFRQSQKMFSGYSKDFLIYYLLLIEVEYEKRYYNNPDYYINAIETFYKECLSLEFRNKIHSLTDSVYIQQIVKDDKLLSSTLLSTNGQTVSWKEILEINQGKVILIDVWATWCKPCIEEFEYLNELKKIFSNNNVAFINISIDDDLGKWKNELTKLNILDNQTQHYQLDYSKNLFKSLSKDGSIPRYVLINQKGEIADLNCPRPSNNELKNKILNLVKK